MPQTFHLTIHPFFFFFCRSYFSTSLTKKNKFFLFSCINIHTQLLPQILVSPLFQSYWNIFLALLWHALKLLLLLYKFISWIFNTICFILPKNYFHGLNLLVLSSNIFTSMFQHSSQFYPFERTTSATKKQNILLNFNIPLHLPFTSKYFTGKDWEKAGYTHHYYGPTILTHPQTKSHLSSFYLTAICSPPTILQ